MKSGRSIGAAALSATAALLYMVFESQWVRCVRRDVVVEDLPDDLDGLTIAHLSDMHAGFEPSLNMRALRQAITWTMSARPDLIAITGDLAGGPANLPALSLELARLQAPLGVYAVMGNHDHGASKVPFVRAVDPREFGTVRLLVNETVEVPVGASVVKVCGVDDVKHGYGRLTTAMSTRTSGASECRLLLSHYAEAALALPPSAFHLTLSGDTHGGQICLPWLGGPIMLSQPRARFKAGLYDEGGRRIHVSRGIGVSLLPFRLLCRPEVVILRLWSPAGR